MGALFRFGSNKRSQAREAVAVCRNELVGLVRAVNVADAKLARAESLRDQCRERLAKASEAAADARAAHAAAMLQAATSGEGVATSSASRESRYTKLDAQEDLRAAGHAVEVLRGEAEGPAAAVREVQDKLGNLVAAVIAEQAEAALAETTRALRALSRQRLVCLALKAYVHDDHPAYQSLASVTYYPYDGIEADRAAIEAEWAATFEALTANPDTPLPSILVNSEADHARGAA